MADINVPMVNGKALSWADITVELFGRKIPGIVSVMYKDMQEKTNEYGAGHMPVSRSYGKYSAECELELELKEMHAIQAAARAAGATRIQYIPAFPVNVAYQAAPGVIINDTIHNCEFTDNVREGTSGDGRVTVKCVLVCSHISWDTRGLPAT